MTLAKSKQSQTLRPSRNTRRPDEPARAAADSDGAEDFEANGSTAAPKVGPQDDQSRSRAGHPRPAAKVPAVQTKRGGTAAAGSMRPPTQQAAPPGHATPVATFVLPPPPQTDSNLSLTRIIEEYGERTDLLKLVLLAKTEQDRARAEYERRVQEELRFETRRLEFEMMLHGNHFKQQEQQQHMMPASVHRSDVVMQSPIGPLAHAPHPQQVGHMVAPVSYGMPPAHDASMRAYHHPDTPGGLDNRGAQNPFAFFKMPLGAQVHHPSAYATHGENSQHNGTAGHAGITSPTDRAANAAIGSRRQVAPAVSGLTVRIMNSDVGAANAPHSAPVDGPEKKRKVSHDEVIMALRRKVMSKGGAQWQSVPQQHPRMAARTHHSAHQKHQSEDASNRRRSSLAVITSVDSAEGTVPSESTTSSSSRSTSSSLTPVSATNGAEPASADAETGADVSPRRTSSIALLVDRETTPLTVATDDGTN
ncbi:hypothetical protein GGH12_001985 [Coemansia sp. RSA 1822]|nr:hypothetical protein GGH12_001985 [Coemansia sp. RSA 1822]